MTEPNKQNGSGMHPTRAEHEDLRDEMRREFKEVKDALKFLGDQARMTGQALELLLAERGLDLPGEDPDA